MTSWLARGGWTFLAVACLATASGCPQGWTLWFAPAVDTGGTCSGGWDCQAGDDCVCGTCAPAGTPATCRGLDASAAGQGCAGQPPVCFRACGDFTPAAPSLAVCGTSGWSCTGGVLLEDCPSDVCWGEPRLGQVCLDGRWTCQYGEARPGVCLTPGACDVLDGGATVAPGCVYTPLCQGAAADCATTWCRQGIVTPATCAAGRFQCTTGVLLDTCTTCAGDAPTCHPTCGDNTVVGLASCTGGLWACGAGILRTACAPNTCWGPRPAGSVGCVEGTWACGDAGPANGGGCLTPGACLGSPPPCYPDLCCTQASTSAQCADLAWSCGTWSQAQDCAERPFCPAAPTDGGRGDGGGLDGGALDAALPRDAGGPTDAAPGETDAAAGDAGALTLLDAGGMDAALGSEDASVRDGGVPDASVPGDAGSVSPDAAIPMGGSTPVCGDDVYEPNNNTAEVSPLLPGPFGSFFAGSPLQLCQGDVDLFPFMVPTGVMLTVALEHTAGAQLTLDVFGPDETLLARAMPAGPSGGRDTQVVAVPVTQVGTVTVAITSSSVGTVAYALTVGLQ